MNKQLAICLLSFLLFPCAIMAQKVIDPNVLDEVYITLHQQSGVLIDSVKYTGNDSQKAGGCCPERSFAISALRDKIRIFA